MIYAENTFLLRQEQGIGSIGSRNSVFSSKQCPKLHVKADFVLRIVLRSIISRFWMAFQLPFSLAKQSGFLRNSRTLAGY
jgi:hypothetical protein